MMDITHATTIVATTFAQGVAIAADRRASAGYAIARRDVDKLMAVDDHTIIGLAGSAGPAVELGRLFIMEVEHHEKVEHTTLSLDAKANRLGHLIASHLPKAREGMVVLPLLTGFDTARGLGRIIEMDITGGTWDEPRFGAIGSGSVHAKAHCKAMWRPDTSQDQAVEMLIGAISSAADEDLGTGGPDAIWHTYPHVMIATADGLTWVSEQMVADIAGRQRAELSTRLDTAGFRREAR